VVANEASRFQKVDLPLRSPGECLVTRAVDGPFIDTRLDIGLDGRPPFRGRVYLSVAAIREMADQAGLFDEYQSLVRQIQTDLGEYEGRSYKQGYEDGLKENQRDDTQLFDLLRDLADRLPHRSDAGVAGGADLEAGAVGPLPSSPDNPFLVGLPAGEGAGAGRSKRPAGVSVNPSDGGTVAVQ
jgi:hypothetical protein